MKIQCSCGHVILDIDANRYHMTHDIHHDALLNAIDAAIELSGTSPKEREAACMAIRYMFGRLTRSFWSCRKCSRIHIDQTMTSVSTFVPEDSANPPGLSSAREMSDDERDCWNKAGGAALQREISSDPPARH